jgi:phospholipid-transporting ATPase
LNKFDQENPFNATSPDEYSLLNFAKFVGFEFKGIDEDENIVINYKDSRLVYKKILIFEFDSDRKRQSILVED